MYQSLGVRQPPLIDRPTSVSMSCPSWRGSALPPAWASFVLRDGLGSTALFLCVRMKPEMADKRRVLLGHTGWRHWALTRDKT